MFYKKCSVKKSKLKYHIIDTLKEVTYMYYYGNNGYYGGGYSAPCCGGGYAGYTSGSGIGAAIWIVLFILLVIIIGAWGFGGNNQGFNN